MHEYERLRNKIRLYVSSIEPNLSILTRLGIPIHKGGFIRVRIDDRTPSCKINKNGSFHDYGTGTHYSDIVSLLYDGFHAFNTLTETIQWLCGELNIEFNIPERRIKCLY